MTRSSDPSLPRCPARLQRGRGTLAIPQDNRPAALPHPTSKTGIPLRRVPRLANQVGILAVRDGALQPQPLGTQLEAKTTLRAYNFFVQDSWRMKPSLTLTYVSAMAGRLRHRNYMVSKPSSPITIPATPSSLPPIHPGQTGSLPRLVMSTTPRSLTFPFEIAQV